MKMIIIIMVGIETDKIILSFIAKPSKKGPQYYFNIPITYIKDGHIKPERKYRIYPKELEEKE